MSFYLTQEFYFLVSVPRAPKILLWKDICVPMLPAAQPRSRHNSSVQKQINKNCEIYMYKYAHMYNTNGLGT